MNSIYNPSEDSYLLEEQVLSLAKDKSVLDMGSGSGILAEAAITSECKSILALDINPESISLLKKKNIPALQSDLFSNLPKTKKFDLIIFNPPYLPEDSDEPRESKRATTGGKRGDELILQFLKQAQSHLNKNGFILLLTSSLTPMNKIDSLLSSLNLNKTLLSSKKLFMESLYVWKIQ